jgi:bacteriorhodopsin
VGILTVFDCSVLVMGTVVVVMVMVWLWVWEISVKGLGVVTAESLTVVRLVGVFDATAVRTAQRDG